MSLKYRLFLFILLFPGVGFAKTHEVQMLSRVNGQSMIFDPGYLKIDIGDQVTFIPTNQGHNSRSVFVPNGMKSWKGKNNKSITVSFEKEGVYIYECSNHYAMAMVGIIQVGAPSNLIKAKKFLGNYKKKFAINKNRLDEYFKKINKTKID